MQPHDLTLEMFAGYPPESRKEIADHLDSLRTLPLSFLPGLLREVIEYDYKFPAERAAIDRELNTLSKLSASQRLRWFDTFQSFRLGDQLERFDWVNQPAQFTEQLSAHLWSTHQLDAYRSAATEYGARLQTASAAPAAPMPRLGIAVIGQGVPTYEGTLFKQLRPHGTYFNRIKPDDGLNLLLSAASKRAEKAPLPFGHWYIDGGDAIAHNTELTSVSYQAMNPIREALLKVMQTQIQQPGMGPEELRTRMARMTPSDVGMKDIDDQVLSRFKLKVFTEGSGTQIFSTSFAQWATREALRRAQPLTLLVRFAPRQRQRPMNELLSDRRPDAEVDLVGSLIDADMAAYYHWINQQRLPGYERSMFVAWFEGHREAVVISPTLPQGTTSSSELDLGQLLELASS